MLPVTKFNGQEFVTKSEQFTVDAQDAYIP